MLFRFFFLLCCTLLYIHAQSQNIEVLAKTVNKTGNIVHAKENVVLYSDRYIITADEAYYDQNSSDLELVGDITILEGSAFSTRSGYAKLNLENDSGSLSPMFAYTGQSALWMQCENATFDDQYYMTHTSFISSCNVQDPDWKIAFSQGTYDRQNKFMSMYNVLFYANDVPFFYLPYFSFPTDKTRRSGLLRPSYAYGSGEGFFYLQPIYFAPQVNWDFELDPHIRTNRGVGVHNTLRFVDSRYSSGQINFGFFNEKQSYVAQNNIKHDQHYGYTIQYDRSKLFSDLFGADSEDGLWADIHYLNDIDYLNTINNDDKVYDKRVESTLNYYIRKDYDYLGIYAKYYIDTSKDTNDKEIQELPTFNYHRLTDTFVSGNIFYSLDYRSSNYTSKTGIDARTHQISAPVSIYFSFFDDYLNLKFTENFYSAQFSYSEGINNNSGSTFQNSHRLSLYTELTKAYEDFYHTAFVGADYAIPGHSAKSSFFKELENENRSDLKELRDTVNLINNQEESLNLSLVEFFYDSAGEKKVSHFMRQSLFFSDYRYKYADLENNLKVYFSKNLVLGNLLNYSHQYSRISKLQTSANLTFSDYKVDFIHTFTHDDFDVKSQFVTLSLATDYIKNYNFFANMSYDIEQNFFKSWELGWNLNQKCWNYRLSYKEELTPSDSTIGSINKRGVYLIFNLVPIGGVGYNFVKETLRDE